MEALTELCYQKCQRIQACSHNQAGIQGIWGGGDDHVEMVILRSASAVLYRA